MQIKWNSEQIFIIIRAIWKSPKQIQRAAIEINLQKMIFSFLNYNDIFVCLGI